VEKDYKDYSWNIILWLILFLVFGIIIITCKPQSQAYIMTVNGPEPPGKLGTTLTHEHILVDFIGADSTGYFRWNRDTVLSKAMPVVMKAKAAGVKTIFECTPEYLGRDPLLLKELSRRSGIILITTTGLYGYNNKFLPQSFNSEDAGSLAQKWTEEFFNGIEGTDIRPGFIKIAVNPADTLSPSDEKIIRAAALTHLNTGLTIASHTGYDNPAWAQINILKENGVDPSAFIWVHAQRGSDERIIEAAREGVWISLDNIRNRPGLNPGDRFGIEWYAGRIIMLKNNGLLHKVLLSHDSGWYDPAQPGGGTINGYTDIFEYLLPVLREKGFTTDDIDRLLVKNPAEAFTISIRKTGNPKP
jgi:phosphotriesterase-related protein